MMSLLGGNGVNEALFDATELSHIGLELSVAEIKSHQAPPPGVGRARFCAMLLFCQPVLWQAAGSFAGVVGWGNCFKADIGGWPWHPKGRVSYLVSGGLDQGGKV
ncbi:hypothetical protein J4E05_15820 [Thalassospira sp. NFXS8]|uniref:hypothetical protein n=1 Tax=Thalassospira sp. NFXS8 TaxID=2819093 RepID=UPI0032DEC4BC